MLLAGLLGLLMILTGCTAHAPGPPGAAPVSPDRPRVPIPRSTIPGLVAAPAGSGPGRYRQQAVSWGPCDSARPQELRCARVLAPLDPAHTETGQPDADRALTLTLGVRPATAQPRAGVIFLNPGGPGGSGLDQLAGFHPQGLEHFDLVSWDPRGVGESTGVRCGDTEATDAYLQLDFSPDDQAEVDRLVQANTQRGAQCLAASGDLLQHVGTSETVADLELLRELLGEPKLNYLGLSYGTEIGARYAHQHPELTGRMVLDGAVSVPGGVTVSQAVGLERALAGFSTWCVQFGCGLGEDEGAVWGRFTQLLQGLDSRPLPVGDRELTESLAMNAITVAFMAGEPGWRTLVDPMLRAESGDGAGMLALADALNGRSDQGYNSLLAANDAVRCLDSADGGVAAARRNQQSVEQQAPTLGHRLGLDLVCETWPVPGRGSAEPVSAPAADQILVIGTTGDPATPVENAEAMARQLGSAKVLIWEGQGHTAYGRGSACVDAAVVRQLTGTIAAGDRHCGS